MAGVGRDLKAHPVSTSCHGGWNQIRSNLSQALSTSMDGTSTAPLDSMFQGLWAKNLPLTCHLNLPSFPLKPFPLALSLSDCSLDPARGHRYLGKYSGFIFFSTVFQYFKNNSWEKLSTVRRWDFSRMGVCCKACQNFSNRKERVPCQVLQSSSRKHHFSAGKDRPTLSWVAEQAKVSLLLFFKICISSWLFFW